MPKQWKLVYYGGILLLLVALVVAVTLHAKDSGHPKGDTDLTAKETTVPLENPDERPSVPLAPADPITGKQRPADAIPAVGSGTVNGADAEKEAEAQPATEKDANEEVPVGPLPLLKEKVIVGFSFSSNDIEKGAYAALNRIAQYLTAHPEQRIVIKGYSDSLGSAGFNETVSGFRANAVKSYLIAKGISADQITIRALGDSDPIASNDTVSGRSKNRRVEIEFLDQ